MKHVLLVVENLPLGRDHRLRKQAASLLDEGYRVSVVCRADPANGKVAGVQVHEYRAPVDGASALGFAREYGYSLAAAGRLIARVYARERFDAIQISGTPDIYFAVAAPFRRRGARVVFDQRDLSPELYEVRYGRRGIPHRVLLRLERASYRAADHVITVNRSLERIARARGGLPQERVSIVGNGPCLTAVERAVARPELRQGRSRMCCWVGVMGPQDRVELAVRAAAQVVNQLGRADTHFAFIGDGESREPAQRLAQELGLAPFSSFPGWLGEQDVHAYLATAEVGLDSNLEEIVSPVKVMEYMAFGLPFVAFDLAETRALGGEAGRYARPADVTDLATHLDALLDAGPQRAGMAAYGRRRLIDDLSWERQARTYLEVYRRLLEPAPGSSETSRVVMEVS